MDKSSLLEWYFAGLRKQALSNNVAHDLTPMALIKADQELLKEKIERELSNVKREGDLAGKGPTSGIDSGSVEIASKRTLQIDIRPFVLGFSVLSFSALIFSSFHNSPAGDQIVKGMLMLTTALGVFTSTICFSQSSASQKLCRLILGSTRSEQPKTVKGSTGQLHQAIDELQEKLQMMKQKELLTFDYCPYILAELDEEGAFKTLNQTAEKTWGYSIAYLLNKEIGDLLHFSSIEALFESMSRCKRMCRPETVEIATISQSGSLVYLAWRSEWSASAQSFYCVAEDITIRVAHENLKTEMRQMLTHDLKAPINNLSMWIYNMLYGTYGEINQEASSSLKKTQQNIQSILLLLENLLDIDKVESGMMPSNKKVFSVQESIDKTTQLLSDWAKEAGVSIEAESTALNVVADEQQVTRILTNFCSNAVKWTPAGKSIIIRATAKDKQVLVEVLDSGPGIPEEVKSNLFERWTSSEGSTKKSLPSTGIGLYMTKKFAELQDGTVGASDREGGGSIFWLSLPAAKNG